MWRSPRQGFCCWWPELQAMLASHRGPYGKYRDIKCITRSNPSCVKYICCTWNHFTPGWHSSVTGADRPFAAPQLLLVTQTVMAVWGVFSNVWILQWKISLVTLVAMCVRLPPHLLRPTLSASAHRASPGLGSDLLSSVLRLSVAPYTFYLPPEIWHFG